MVDGESMSREAMDGARAAPGAGAWEGASIPGPRFPQSRPVREMLGERLPARAGSWSGPRHYGHPVAGSDPSDEQCPTQGERGQHPHGQEERADRPGDHPIQQEVLPGPRPPVRQVSPGEGTDRQREVDGCEALEHASREMGVGVGGPGRPSGKDPHRSRTFGTGISGKAPGSADPGPGHPRPSGVPVEGEAPQSLRSSAGAPGSPAGARVVVWGRLINPKKRSTMPMNSP